MSRYLVMTERLPSFDPQWLDAHYAFLEELRRAGLLELTGPFGDASGGAYLFRARSLEEARAVAETDPLHRHNCSAVLVREWHAEQAGAEAGKPLALGAMSHVLPVLERRRSRGL